MVAPQVGPLLRWIFRGPTGKRNCGSKAYQKVCLKGKKKSSFAFAGRLLSQSEISVFV